MSLGFICAMFGMFVTFSIFFVAMIFSYKTNRLRNVPIGVYKPGEDEQTGTNIILGWDGYFYWLLLPISTVALYFFLKRRVNKNLR